jgi:Rrf2 family protein
MIYSSACAHAIRALARLALMRPDGYLLLEELCAGTDLPRHFVAKILQELVRRGLLTSAKGRGGGFALARTPEKITLYEIVACVDGVEQLEHCVVGLAQCDDQQPCPQHDTWKGIRVQLRTFLKETSLATMAMTLKRKMQLLGEALPTAATPSKPVRVG